MSLSVKLADVQIKKKEEETPWSFLPDNNEDFLFQTKLSVLGGFLLHMVAEVLFCLLVEISFSESNPAVVTERQQLFAAV